MIQQSHSWATIQGKMWFKRIHAPPWSLTSFLQLSRHGRNLNVQGQMNGCRKCVTYIQWNITQPEKEPKCHVRQHARNWRLILSEVSQKKKEKYHMIL